MRRRRFQLPLLKGGGGLEDAALGDLAKVLGHDGATAHNVLLGLWLTSEARPQLLLLIRRSHWRVEAFTFSVRLRGWGPTQERLETDRGREWGKNYCMRQRVSLWPGKQIPSVSKGVKKCRNFHGVLKMFVLPLYPSRGVGVTLSTNKHCGFLLILWEMQWKSYWWE